MLAIQMALHRTTFLPYFRLLYPRTNIVFCKFNGNKYLVKDYSNDQYIIRLCRIFKNHINKINVHIKKQHIISIEASAPARRL